MYFTNIGAQNLLNPPVQLQKCIKIYSTTNLCCKDGEDEFAGIEGVEDVGDDCEVAGGGNVRLEAHVGELGLRRDVDSDVLPQPVILLLLTGNLINKKKIFRSVRSVRVHIAIAMYVCLSGTSLS